MNLIAKFIFECKKVNHLDKDIIYLPVSYFGPISYYSMIASSETLIERYENYQKRTVRNRCHLLGPNGKQILSVPLAKGKTQSKIQDVRISYDMDWQKNHIETINTAYRSSPYFHFYFDRISELISSNYKYLYDLDLATMEFLCTSLDIETPTTTKTFIKPEMIEKQDLRYQDEVFNTTKETVYQRVYESVDKFTRGVSALDALFNLGPEVQDLFNYET